MSEQCKEIEENHRRRKTSDLFKRIRDTKGTFHAKVGTIKDRNGQDLKEEEKIKRWQEYTESTVVNEIHVIKPQQAQKSLYFFSRQFINLPLEQ